MSKVVDVTTRLHNIIEEVEAMQKEIVKLTDHADAEDYILKDEDIGPVAISENRSLRRAAMFVAAHGLGQAVKDLTVAHTQSIKVDKE